VWADFNNTNAEALHKAELLGGLPSVVLLVVAFGGVIAAGLPLVLALAGIAVGFAALHLLSAITPLSVWSMNFSMMIGLAVGIDYSLFIVSRYRQERAGGADVGGGIANTLATAGKAVFLSALTVVASLPLLPALLVLLGDRVLTAGAAHGPNGAVDGRWARLTDRTLAHPKRYLLAGVVLLVALAAPAAGIRLGMPGAGVVDQGRSSRDGYDRLIGAFGPGAAAPVFVTVNAGEATRVVLIAGRDAAVVASGVASLPAATGRTVVRVIGATAVDDPATARLVRRLRTELAAAARYRGDET